MASLTNGHELRKLWETVKDREACHAVVHRVAKSQMQLSNWTKILSERVFCLCSPLGVLYFLVLR